MQDPALPPDAFRLGSLVVVPSLNRLVRGERSADVEPRVMGVLAALAEAPGEVVTRAALFESVWAGAVVNDEALTRAVSELRKALGPDARGAVETIRGRGYRLAAPTEPLRADPLAFSARAAPPAEAPRHNGVAVPERARAHRGVVLAVFALVLAAVSLVVSLREAPFGGADLPRAGAESAGSAREPFRLDSTSQYYLPGASELGVYYDSSTSRYFRFVADSD